MSSGQKVLKILAIILAIFIIVNICSAIIFGISLFSGIMYSSKRQINNSSSYETTSEIDVEKIEELRENVKLEIDLETSNLEIKQGEKFQVEKVNAATDLKCKVRGNTLEIKEKNSNWFHNRVDESSTVVVYIPEDVILDSLEIDTGIGIAQIDGVKTMKLDIDAGAGKITLNHVTAQKSDIDGGAGNFTISDSVLANLDLDCGVGVTKISGDIKGNSKISCGVGKTELNLIQEKDNYTIQTETGIGSITVNGVKCVDRQSYGNGENVIRIDGGVGSVEITTK